MGFPGGAAPGPDPGLTQVRVSRSRAPGPQAAAADAARWQGVGIDLERLGPLAAGLVADAFTAGERERIAAAASATGEPVENWQLAAWGAKEALGKALGRGVLGGPLGVEVVQIDGAAGKLALELRGQMAEAFPQWSAASARPAALFAWRRLHGPHVVTLCLLPRE